MAIFEEKQPSLWACVTVLALVFILAYPVWHLNERELFWNEGDYAAAAMEIDFAKPVVTVHGEVRNDIYPFFPMLCSAVSKCGVPMEQSLRAVSVASLAGLAAIVFLTCLRASGLQAAAAGTAILITSIITAEKGVEGYPHMLTALLIYSGWLAWFNFCLGSGKWQMAWFLTGIFAGLTFYNAGPAGLMYFLIPLAFQHRPLTIWNKLNGIGFYAGVGAVALFILLWWAPRIGLGDNAAAFAFWGDFYPSTMLKHAFKFPFDAMLRFMPWTLMLWAPFCSALIPLDRNPLFGKYHRILFAVLFVIIWLNPLSRSRDMLYLAPLAATMIGTYYWVVVRRYSAKFFLLFSILSACLILAAAGVGIYLFVPFEMSSGILHLERQVNYTAADKLLACAETSAAFLIGITGIAMCRKRMPVWLTYSAIFCGCALLFWAAVNPYRAANTEKKLLAQEVTNVLQKENVPPDVPLYKADNISGLAAETFYTGRKVKLVKNLDKIPSSEGTVYMFTTLVPASSNRTWSKLSDTYYRKNRLCIYKGVPIPDEDEGVYDYDE